ERVALRAGQEQRRDAQVAGEAAVEHRADVPAAIDPVVRLAAQVECRFADERAQAALGHERLRAPRVTAEQRPWIARRCDLVLLVAVLERDVERQPARRVARVRAPALAFEVVALVAVQQERRERCLEVADLPGLDRRDDRAGGKTDAQLAAAEELLRAHRITDPIATQWAVALRAQDRERLDAQRAPSAGFDPRPDGDGQAFDAVVVGAQLQHEPRVTRGQAGTAPVRTPAPALPARLALAFGAAVHQQRAADAAAPYAAYLAAHDRDVTGNGAAGQELDVAVDDDELALDAPRQNDQPAPRGDVARDDLARFQPPAALPARGRRVLEHGDDGLRDAAGHAAILQDEQIRQLLCSRSRRRNQRDEHESEHRLHASLLGIGLTVAAASTRARRARFHPAGRAAGGAMRRARVSPCARIHRSSAGRAAAVHASRSSSGGSSGGSSLSRNVPQCMATKAPRPPRSRYARTASSGSMCMGRMNQRGAYAPIGSSTAS